MENLLESNERTLVIFDSVASGIAECLALVHADIKHMTIHKDKLAQKIINDRKFDDFDTEFDDTITEGSIARAAAARANAKIHQEYSQKSLERSQRNSKTKVYSSANSTTNITATNVNNNTSDHGQHEEDPHHLARLKLLDKRLADTFSRALSMCDQQNSSIAAKQRQNQTNSIDTNTSNRTSIFQVLLGKTSLSRAHSANRKKGSQNTLESSNESEQEDNYYAMIDDINKQIRLAMQYSKQLEAHLFKIEDLRARYEMHLKMGLVVRSISRAYLSNSSSPSSSPALASASSSPSPHVGGQLLHKSASHSSLKRAHKQQVSVPTSKTTIKEFIDNINRLETIFESHMGSFMLSIEDIQGFARVCQGDVFEIQIKYGETQKFKTRVSVLKDSRQKCDNRQTVFKAKVADIIAIKAYECKGLGKKVLLGNKLCETRDLFTARSQLMTISLNQAGSIKLNLIITWNPLHMVPELPKAQVSPGHDVSHFSLPRAADC